MRLLCILLLIINLTSTLYAQETLDVTKNRDCELFPEKGKFNAEERLKEIKEIGGRLVTVYLVKGKDNKVKSKYSGRVDLRSIDDAKLSLDTRTKVLVVTVDQGNGKMIAYFPLTYDENYRIYLTDCLIQ
jgi:endo-alpha-1,4-polygalactosaminidase (GH114 family)